MIYGIIAALALIGIFGGWMYYQGKRSAENKYNKLNLKAVDEYGKRITKINRLDKRDYSTNDILSGKIIDDS